MVELIYGEPAIAFQSLYFEYGSQQGLHRDPMFVFTEPIRHRRAEPGRAPRTRPSASVSMGSPTGVPVPCASTYVTDRGGTPASA